MRHCWVAYFYPRPPRGGRRYKPFDVGCAEVISIHALREEGDFHEHGYHDREVAISIHALREEGDDDRRTLTAILAQFLSTPSARRATGIIIGCPEGQEISIHALREEGDATAFWPIAVNADFYPRPPRGGRRRTSTSGTACCNFYPRPPRGGRHGGPSSRPHRAQYFYPRPPRGGRPSCWHQRRRILYISIHALREEGDEYMGGLFLWLINFYPRPPRGGRPSHLPSQSRPCEFLSTPSARRATFCAIWMDNAS